MSHRGPRVCSKCHAPVAYWRNANREDSYLKVDLSFDDAGTVQKIVSTDPVTRKPLVWGKRLTGRDLADALANGERLHQLHSQTCSATRISNPKPEGLEIPGLTTTQKER